MAAPRRISATEEEERGGGYLRIRGLEVNSKEELADGGVARFGGYCSSEDVLRAVELRGSRSSLPAGEKN